MDDKVCLPSEYFEGRIKDWVGCFDELLTGGSARFGPLTSEKGIEKTDRIFCSAFQNLRLGSINRFKRNVLNFMVPKRRFWTDEQMMKCGFSIDFSVVRRPNRVLTPAKRTSKMRFSSFVPSSKIFVWGP